MKAIHLFKKKVKLLVWEVEIIDSNFIHEVDSSSSEFSKIILINATAINHEDKSSSIGL